MRMHAFESWMRERIISKLRKGMREKETPVDVGDDQQALPRRIQSL